ncbi:hypothetical protein JTE90_021448 [Oedothorax gibbosus]|uniref:Uncharacterized protein n=1 Tax=Oedothorax gibbosus TaxID=931172 RepID=A0AAV6VW34_9ARAC|nr:hypothetical protein JTE90_021448 [Oedothorax gibbosus]
MLVRWVALLALLAVLEAAELAETQRREKRQVTYHASGYQESREDEDNHSVQPSTKKPLPFRVVYPGDLSSFYTTESPNISRGDNSSQVNTPAKKDRRKRSEYLQRRIADNKRSMKNPSTSYIRNEDVQPMESRLHSSYHSPSVSIMNDVPVEMTFNGAGFLRYEDDDSDNERKAENGRTRNSGSRRSKASQNQNRALDDFKKAFNVSRERVQSHPQFDDESPHQGLVPPFQASEGTGSEYGTQGAENGSPLSVDYMTAFQNAFQNPYQGMFGGSQFNFDPTQTTQLPQTQQLDPFSFNYASMFGGQSNANQMTPPQQEAFMQNHRVPQMSNPNAISNQAMYSAMQQYQQQQQQHPQTFAANPTFTQPNPDTPQQTHKTQNRRKRSILNDEVTSASHQTRDHHGYTQVEDQQDSGSAFIPISGNFNGGTIQLNIPFYGQAPIITPNFQHRPQIHNPYSSSGRAEGRHYGGGGGSGERFYHPSEARRYSYGVLGSGNFEVIRGGLFPGERQQSYRGGGGYQNGRVPYGGDGWNGDNYGTTEIIIDGPIQGFQGFDNFQLINALSKHSEIAIRPEDRHDSEEHSY